MIVYSKQFGTRRRIIDADDDSEYDACVAALNRGEGFFYMTHAEYDAITDPNTLNYQVVTRAGFSATLEHTWDGVPHRVIVHYKHSGKHPSDDWDVRLVDRHAIIHSDGTTVIGACHADPSCGDDGAHIAPGHTIVQHKDAGTGWTYDGRNFTDHNPPYVPPSQRPPH
ncbi:MAG: hypothetical protein HRJ53_01975 [Acidobacteria bacterium Pan2503]|uniref:Uncharacterized protein n=1 Tax=Candidatus Acidiferrum panamense TaxID=2741543 RepID=A0A7V8NMF7_9BACT|nr:hypothetical protein [Candidatus Acidoferrum panamensis]